MDAFSPAHVSLGWLWFDDDPKTSLEEKVQQAAGRFQQKFGQPPRLCYVNERMLNGQPTTCGPTRLVGAGNVLPGHFLFVVEGGRPD